MSPPAGWKPLARAELGRGVELEAKDLFETEALRELFKDIPQDLLREAIARLPGSVVLREYKKGEVICREGEYGATAFYLLTGKVEVFLNTALAHAKSEKDESLFKGPKRWIRKFTTGLKRDEEDPRPTDAPRQFIPIDASVFLDRQHPTAEMGPGDFFGEMSCLNFYPRSATIRALEDVKALEMLRNILKFLRSSRAFDYHQKVGRPYEQRTIRSLFLHLSAFGEIPMEEIDKLVPRAKHFIHNPGDAILRQGDPPHRCYSREDPDDDKKPLKAWDAEDAYVYFIRLGFVKVSHTYPGGELILRYLHSGEYFGAAALLTGQPRTATCAAVDHVQVVALGKKDVDPLMEKYPRLRMALEADLERTKPESLSTLPTPRVPLADFFAQGLLDAQNLLVIDLERCTRCDDCVRACADSHDGITRLVREGVRYEKYLVTTSCRACADPVCMKGCPVGSIHRTDSLEIRIEDWCIGCDRCAQQCPYGNITMHPFMYGLIRCKDAVLAAAFSLDGQRLATGGSDGTARLWDVKTGQEAAPSIRHGSEIHAAAISLDGKRVATGGKDGTARIWNAETGEAVGKPMCHRAVIRGVAFSPDGRRVVTASEDWTARLWDAATGEPLGTEMGHQNGVSAVAFSLDGKRVMTGSKDGTARFWDGATGGAVGRVMDHGKAVGAVAFCLDGQRVATAAYDNSGRFWDAQTGGLLKKKEEPNPPGTAEVLAFNPDGTQVVAGCRDGTAWIWDVGTGAVLNTDPIKHEREVTAIAFSPDGRLLVTASSDGTARVWDAKTGRVAVAKKAVTCDLCSGASVPNCVYACPHDAAIRVAPIEFFGDRLGARRAE